jgi:hypothetical protein
MRALILIAALTALAASPAANAQERACKKVQIYFSCLDGSEARGKYPCNRGESEADCCARWKERARTKWCKGTKGPTKWDCGCVERAEDDANAGLRRTLKPAQPPRGKLTPADPLRREIAPPESNRRQLGPIKEAPSGEIDPKDPPKGTLKPNPPPKGHLAPATCRQAEYAFACANGKAASGKLACRDNESLGQCCKRARSDAARKCIKAGGPAGFARFHCKCARGKPSGLLRR